MIGFGHSQNVAGILYQSMLKAASGSDERHTSFTREPDGEQSAIHTAIRAARSEPYTVKPGKPGFRVVAVQFVCIYPHGLRVESESFRSMRNGLFGRHVIGVLRVIVRNNPDANGRFIRASVNY